MQMTRTNNVVPVERLGPQKPELGASRPKELDKILLLHGPSSNLFGGELAEME